MRAIDKVRKKVYLDGKHLVHIIGNVLMIIGAIIVFINPTEKAYSFYWLAIGLALLGSVYYCDQYGKEGKTQIRKVDKKWATKISGKAQEKPVLAMVVGASLVCIIFILEIFYKDITRNVISVIYSLVIMIIYQTLLIYFTNNLYKEIVKTEKSIIDSHLKK